MSTLESICISITALNLFMYCYVVVFILKIKNWKHQTEYTIDRTKKTLQYIDNDVKILYKLSDNQNEISKTHHEVLEIIGKRCNINEERISKIIKVITGSPYIVEKEKPKLPN